MRLTKTLYIVEEIESDEPIGYDSVGRPVYGYETVKSSFLGEVEPYSARLAETTYGVTVDVSNRVFCEPHEKLKLGASVEYKNSQYEVTECMEYDKHYEVLLKKVLS
jgi:hypothetical protein